MGRLEVGLTGIATVVCLTAGPLARAEPGPFEWLARINNASRELNYEGTFVYQQGNRLETMRIVHAVRDGRVQERLVSLSGVPREVIRTEREVRCYLSDQKAVMVEARKSDLPRFPSMLPARLQDVRENYELELGRTARVAGRTARQVVIKPRDDYRYGYHLWADSQTGLLLRADLVDNRGATLERFMFTQIEIGANIPTTALAPQIASDGFVWYRGDTAIETDESGARWGARQLPKGFRLAQRLTRRMPMGEAAEHLVYTDGLAAVSVFVEKREAIRGPVTEPGHFGALYTYGKRMNGHHVTVIGEVPAKTVSLIGESVAVVNE